MSRNSRSVFCGSTQTTGLTVVAVQFGTYREFIALQDLRMCSRFVVVDDFARNVLDVLRAVLDLRPVTVSPDQSAAATSFHRRRAMFADLLVGCLQFCHGSTEPRKVGRTQRSVVIVQILTVHGDAIADEVRGLWQAAVVTWLRCSVTHYLAYRQNHRRVETCPVTVRVRRAVCAG